jgi:hypothetical protein
VRKKPAGERRYLLTEQQLLEVVDAVVTLPSCAIASMLANLEAHPELAPAWLEQRYRCEQSDRC